MTVKKLTMRQKILVAGTLFGMFFGAGNLIFPVHLGQLAGRNVIPAIIGFIVTAVGIPIFGVAAIGITHSDGLQTLSSKVGKGYGIFFTCLLYLTIGPLFAIPRCATVSFTTGVSPMLSEAAQPLALLLFSAVFFAFVLFFSLRPGKITVWIGKIINPVFLLFLAVLVIAALLNPGASISAVAPTEPYATKTSAFFSSFIEGYGTMDAIAGLAFGIVVIDVIRRIGVDNDDAVAVDVLGSGVLTGILMAVIYVVTILMGTQSRGLFEISDNGGIALTQIAGHYFGGVGQIILAVMPYTDLEGIGPGSIVDNTGDKLNVRAGDKLIGRIIDALGNPLDDGEPIEYTDTVPIAGIPVNPLTRPKIHEPIELGVKAIDGLLTMGKGQRMGIFAGSGVGKSTLMGMIARKVKADLNVIALVGERGREVREFIENDLGEEGMARSVVVVATSDQPAMMRNKCPMTATAIAEYFCSQGKDVLLMMDNLTRFAMAQREIGLSTGEPPVARGYTPSIYAAMPKLLERAGNFEKGSITGIYAVLVEGDDTNEPISDTVRGIIDGHIVLSRKIAAQNHYPAIDILPSISRLMSAIADPEHNKAAGKLRNLLALYNNNADLISIGAYKKGTNPALDEAIKKIDKINDFLMQGMYESFSMEDTIKLLKAAVS